MKIAAKTAFGVEDIHHGALQGRAQPPKDGERASFVKRSPEGGDAFAGSVIRVGVARVPSQRLNPRK